MPHLIECVHVERKVVERSAVVCYWAVGVSVELDDGIDEVPYGLV